MALFSTLTGGYGEGDGAPVAETQLVAPVAIAAGQKARVTDFTVTGNAVAWFWLSTGVAGAAGHFYSMYLPAAGTLNVSLESPMEIAGGNSIYCHYNPGGAGNLFSARWDGELFVVSY